MSEEYEEEEAYERRPVGIDYDSLRYLEEHFEAPDYVRDIFWAHLSKNLNLGNLSDRDEDIIHASLDIAKELTVASIPPRKFSMRVWRDLEQVETAALVAITRARKALERKLLASQISIKEIAGGEGTKPSILGSLFGRRR